MNHEGIADSAKVPRTALKYSRDNRYRRTVARATIVLKGGFGIGARNSLRN